jgi:thioesterase domain-containing protein
MASATIIEPRAVILVDLEEYRRALMQVWAEVLPSVPFAEDLTWNEAGVDSLATLHLLLRLEEALQTELSFDLFARDLRLGDLAQHLMTSSQIPAEPPQSGLRTLFLAPGILGDEPRLANLRAALGGIAHCETLDLPELGAPLEVLESLEATAALLAARIQERQPHGPISIGGYSYGGFLAQQISTELESAGREVDRLYLFDPVPPLASNIDTPPTAIEAPPAGVKSLPHANAATSGSRFVRRPDESYQLFVERLAFQFLLRTRQFRAARALALRSWSKYDFSRRTMRRRDLLTVFRGNSLRRWQPKACAARTVLFAGELAESIDYSVFWQRLCPHLSVEHLGANHWALFEPKPLKSIVARLTREFAASPGLASDRAA